MIQSLDNMTQSDLRRHFMCKEAKRQGPSRHACQACEFSSITCQEYHTLEACKMFQMSRSNLPCSFIFYVSRTTLFWYPKKSIFIKIWWFMIMKLGKNCRKLFWIFSILTAKNCQSARNNYHCTSISPRFLIFCRMIIIKWNIYCYENYFFTLLKL